MSLVTLYKEEIKELGRDRRFVFHLEEHDMNGLPYAAKPIEYALPNGYSIGETKWGEAGIFDADDMLCDISSLGETPKLISARGEILLSRA